MKKEVPAVSPTTTTRYIYSGAKVVAEYENGAAVGSPTREYVYLGAQLLATLEGGTTTYHHPDHLSVRASTDSTGAIPAGGEQGHYPFGEEWYKGAAGTRTQFTSYERDSESGLDYAMFRYDSSMLGRFMTPDPLAGSISNPQSLNRYGYVVNDPINLIDPLGLDHIPFHGTTCTGPDGNEIPCEESPCYNSNSETWGPCNDGGGGGNLGNSAGGVQGNPSGCQDVYIEGFYAGNTCRGFGGLRFSEAGRGGGLLGGGINGDGNFPSLGSAVSGAGEIIACAANASDRFDAAFLVSDITGISEETLDPFIGSVFGKGPVALAILIGGDQAGRNALAIGATTPVRSTPTTLFNPGQSIPFRSTPIGRATITAGSKTLGLLKGVGQAAGGLALFDVSVAAFSALVFCGN